MRPAPASHRRDWEDLSEVDLFWSILSDPAKRHGGWDEHEYLASGLVEVDMRLTRAAGLGHSGGWDHALDFGCGAGRLTQALSARCERVVGVDISAQMIGTAERLAAGKPKCAFVLADRPDLGMFQDGSFDLVFTTIVLQHMPSRAAIRRYLVEFVRVLRPGGLIIFQLPSFIPARHRLQLRPRAYRLLRAVGVPPATLYRRLRLQPIRMRFLPTADVQVVLEQAGASVLAVDETPVSGIVSAVYYITK